MHLHGIVAHKKAPDEDQLTERLGLIWTEIKPDAQSYSTNPPERDLMRPLEETITDQSRLKAQAIRLNYAELENSRLQKMVDANSKPFLEKISELRKALEASEADLTAEKAKRRRTRKAPADAVDPITALQSLATLHIIELAERLQAAGLDTAPGPQILYLNDMADPLPDANQKFISIRTPVKVPLEPEPVPTKRRRTRKAPAV